MSPPLMSPSAALADTRLSFDADRPPALNGINGTNGKHSHSDSKGEDDEGLDVVDRLQRDLARTNEEKEQLATQYRNLLAKLTTMRTQLGNKLKQDAVCTLHHGWFILSYFCRRKSWTGENNRLYNSKLKMRTLPQQ